MYALYALGTVVMTIVDVERLAEPGICSCGRRVVRGVDQHDELVLVDVWAADAAAELLAWDAGRASFYLVQQMKHPRGLILTRRRPVDIKRYPAGTTAKRVVLEHCCLFTREGNG